MNWNRLLGVSGCTLAMLVSAGACASAAKKTTISYYHGWGGDLVGQGLANTVKEFERLHPNYRVKITTGATMDKLLAAIAAGISPDVAMVDEKVSSYVLLRMMDPIDDLIKASGVAKADFYAPSWEECVYQGKVWAMPWGADANFGFLWNKGIFAATGLDPERPPKTLAELDAISPKLTIMDGAKVKQMAIVPMYTGYGFSNAIYTWGWAFGGEFFDYARDRVTANDPKIIKAVEWMNSIATKVGGVSRVIDNFAMRQVAMAGYTTLQVKETRQKAPKLDFGITRMPTVSASVKPGWVGGHKVIIPLGTKNRKAAWELVRWLTADPVGTAIPMMSIGSTPAYRLSNIYDVYRKDPNYAPFLDILDTAPHFRAAMPVAEFYFNQLGVAMSNTFAGKKGAALALDECTVRVQKELDRVLARYKSRQKK